LFLAWSHSVLITTVPVSVRPAVDHIASSESASETHNLLSEPPCSETVFLENCYFVIQLQVQNANPVLLVETAADAPEDDDDSVESVVLSEWIKEQERELKEQATSPYVVTSRLDAKIRDSPLTRRSCPARWIDWLLSKLSSRYRNKIESLYLPSLIQKQITKKMDGMLRKKMIEKDVVAETEVLPESQQARYFFDHLKEIRGV